MSFINQPASEINVPVYWRLLSELAWWCYNKLCVLIRYSLRILSAPFLLGRLLPAPDPSFQAVTDRESKAWQSSEVSDTPALATVPRCAVCL